MNYLIDIDGTLLNGSDALTGAVDFIDRLNQNHANYLLMTNSIKNVEVQQNRLAQAGINVQAEKILNPIVAINKYLLNMKIQKVKIIGSEAEIKQIKACNVKQDYEAVILLDFEKLNFGYDVIQGIIDDVENDINVLTASLSTFYLKNGRKALDTGAFVKIIEEITGAEIKNFGKPSQEYFDVARKILNAEKNSICVIGDDWKTDVTGANEYGAKSVLVKTGKYQKDDELRCTPHKIVENLTEL